MAQWCPNSTEALAVQRRGAVYNLAIPNAISNVVPSIISNSLRRGLPSAAGFRVVARIWCVTLAVAMAAQGIGWSAPEQQLARRIAAVTGTGTIALIFENRSSLGKRDSEVIQNGLRSALEGVGIRFARSEQVISGQTASVSTAVRVSLSENAASYVWVAEIRQSAGEPVVVMVSVPRPESSISSRESVPLSLRKISLWTQDDAILDVAVLEENATPSRIAVLDAEKITLYRLQAGKWQLEQTLGIVHARPWPRDLRGRLIPAKDHLLDVYLPGVICRSVGGAPVALTCREADDPWPLVPAALGGSFSTLPSAGPTSAAIAPVGAFYASTRNFFTGALTAGVGKFTTVPKFYSAAVLPRDKSTLWLFAATDGRVHMVDGMSDQASRLDWGSDLASVKTACGSGWQVLATSSEETNGDSVRAYEFPDRDAVAVSAAIDFAGGVITALWTEAKADTAIAVVRNRETGSYEAFRLAVTCSQ
jgi:hypothetical protein